MKKPPASTKDSQQSPYRLKQELSSLPETERQLAEQAALLKAGQPSFERWQQWHAFGVVMGQPLSAFPPGPYAFYLYSPSPPTFSVLPEIIDAPDLRVIARATGMSRAEVANATEEELRDAISDQLWDHLLGAYDDNYYKLAGAPTLFELLENVARLEPLFGDLTEAERPFDQVYRDARLAEGFEAYREIQDLRLRRMALGIAGYEWSMTATSPASENDSRMGRGSPASSALSRPPTS